MTARNASQRSPEEDAVHAFGRATAAALRSLYRSEIADEYSVHAVTSRSAVALVTSARVAEFNRVINLGLFESGTVEQLDGLVELYAHQRVPFMVQLSPIARPRELESWLIERGFRSADEWTVMSRNLSAPIADASSHDTVQIGPSEASLYARVHEAAFGLAFGEGNLAAKAIGESGWHHYLVRDERRPFAAAAMFVHERTALFAGSGTLHAETGRGAQAALVIRRLRDAAAFGCDFAFVETDEDLRRATPAALRNVMRSGFTVAFRERTYVYDRGLRVRLDLASGRWA